MFLMFLHTSEEWVVLVVQLTSWSSASSSVTALDLSVSSFCSLICVTLSLTWDLREKKSKVHVCLTTGEINQSQVNL